MEILLLYFFCIITVVSALGVVLLTNLLHAVLSFMITLLGVAVLFLYAGAEFLAVSQIMIYAGGILILIVFGLMLTSKIGEGQSNGNHSNTKTAALLGLALFGFFGYKLLGVSVPAPTFRLHTLQNLGFLLLTEHLFTFEMITILLIIALVGAAFISKGINNKDGSI